MWGEIKRWVRRMRKLTEVFWESVPKSSRNRHRLWNGCRTSERMRLEERGREEVGQLVGR